ncbi:metalloregulator ArsR/SmtB family transcription factor [Leptolyngbya sp. PL-A3]|uniref:ArsR/SmtB family transcription factor n=1 Tax=Leptolyngbya sp. PL-A3 TaxID=2933911 RepID=UPI003299C77D
MPSRIQPQLKEVKGQEPKQGCCGAIAPITLSGEQAQQYSEWFKVLADPTRLRILNLLANNAEPICVCDIVDHFDLGQPTISHHLRILRDSCFVKTERRANFIYYSINQDCISALPQAAQLIMGI